MPIVNFRLTDENMTLEQKKALIEGATELLVQVLNKPRSTVDVIIEEIHIDNWGVGGKTIRDIQKEQLDLDSNKADP